MIPMKIYAIFNSDTKKYITNINSKRRMFWERLVDAKKALTKARILYNGSNLGIVTFRLRPESYDLYEGDDSK